MTQSSAHTMPGRSGEAEVPGERRVSRTARERSARTARRRWLILFAVVVLGVAAVLANIGPLTHLREAGARLDKVTGEVSALEAQKDQLQGQLAKLSQTGYLETLARQQLTYARPGEELYIITGREGRAGGQTASATAGVAGILSTEGQQVDAADALDATPTAAAGEDAPGFLERLLSSIRGLF